MQKNIDFLTFIPQRESSWTFFIKGKARKLSNEYMEILEITKKFFEIIDGFFIPTSMKYVLRIESHDIHVNEAFKTLGRKINPIKVSQRFFESDHGLTYNDFYKDASSFNFPEGSVRYIGRIQITGGKTKIILEDNDEYIDRNSKGLYAYCGLEDTLDFQELYGQQSLDDPLIIDISHSPSKGGNQYAGIDDPAYYTIVFDTYTDIWFDNSTIGLANRRRLHNVFKRINDNFEVAHTFVLSDWYAEEELMEIVNQESPDIK
jgi:hypothetical protein